MLYVEASAKTRINVDFMFHELVRTIRKFDKMASINTSQSTKKKTKSKPMCTIM
jgi:hypothetical protein